MVRTHALRCSRTAPALWLALAALPLVGCERAAVREPPATPAREAPAAATPRYQREFVFVGELADTPLVVPFSFSAYEREGGITRTARGWLGHGSAWDPFLDESWASGAAGGVWRVVPRPELRVIAGASEDVEALVFRRGERALRLQLGEALTGWSGGEAIRYRILQGRLHFRGTAIPGTVLETQRILPASPTAAEAGGEFDWLFLSDQRSLRLLLAAATGAVSEREHTFGWVVLADGEHSWDQAEISWLELRPFPEARRDIPLHWSFRLPQGGWEGEVRSLGFAAEVGAERGGRRAVEIRHTVEGWVSQGDTRHRVVGMLRHVQE